MSTPVAIDERVSNERKFGNLTPTPVISGSALNVTVSPGSRHFVQSGVLFPQRPIFVIGST